MSAEFHSRDQQKEDTVRAVEVTVRLVLVAGLLIWCFQILQPFLSTIVWALIIASALFPLFAWFRDKIGRSNGVSSAIFTLVILAAILTPSFMLSGTLISTAREYATELEDGTLHVPPAPEKVKEWPVVGERLFAAWDLANQNLGAALEKFEKQLRDAANWLLRTAAGAGLGILQFAAAVVVAGVFLAYNEGGGTFARRLGKRLAGSEGENFAAMASSTIRSVAQGVLGVAVIQAVAAGIGLMIWNVPGAGLWTLIVLMLAIVQLPTLIIGLPLIIYVFSVESTLSAVLFTVWMMVVGLSDNILKPLLLGRGSSRPMAVIFLGAIGGFVLSGIVGLFVGAVVLALGYDLFMLWLNEGDAEAAIAELQGEPLALHAGTAGEQTTGEGASQS
jgi:predicted PurR-regulated permease PerM